MSHVVDQRVLELVFEFFVICNVVSKKTILQVDIKRGGPKSY